jgi:Ca2+-binding RTX toxin-like protein
MCFQISDLGGTLLGTGKADNLRGSSLNNIITTYGGPDRIAGLAGIDYIVSGKGSDSIYGGDDNDILIAQGGRDILDGGLGDDFLDGGIGRDRLTGGLSADKFAFTSRPRKGGADKIVDFSTHEADTIWVSKDAFGIAADARLTIEVINRPRELAEALASENLFVLDSSSGSLYFNSNGVNGGAGGSGGLFAVLMNYQDSEEAFGVESILLV